MKFKVLDSLGLEGKIEGIAEKDLSKSEILVLEDVTPNLIFYVLNKKALIYSRGLLAHISIVALEFKVPVVRVSKEDLEKILKIIEEKGKIKIRIDENFVEILF